MVSIVSTMVSHYIFMVSIVSTMVAYYIFMVSIVSTMVSRTTIFIILSVSLLLIVSTMVLRLLSGFINRYIYYAITYRLL